MVESIKLSSQYQNILERLERLNPKIDREKIENDVKDYLFNLFINEIKHIKSEKGVSDKKFRRDLIKQKLQSMRQPSRLKTLKRRKLKKDEEYLKLKHLKSYFFRKDLKEYINYSGTYNKKEIIYANHTDKTHQKDISEIFEKYGTQKIDLDLNKFDYYFTKEGKDFQYFGDRILKPSISFLEETEDILTISKEKEIISTQTDITKGKLKEKIELELIRRIQNLEIKPIDDRNKKDLNLLDYIGFVDKEEEIDGEEAD